MMEENTDRNYVSNGMNQALAIYKQAGAKKEIERTKRDIKMLKGK